MGCWGGWSWCRRIASVSNSEALSQKYRKSKAIFYIFSPFTLLFFKSGSHCNVPGWPGTQLCSWPRTYRDLPTSASRVRGLTGCATIQGSSTRSYSFLPLSAHIPAEHSVSKHSARLYFSCASCTIRTFPSYPGQERLLWLPSHRCFTYFRHSRPEWEGPSSFILQHTSKYVIQYLDATQLSKILLCYISRCLSKHKAHTMFWRDH